MNDLLEEFWSEIRGALQDKLTYESNCPEFEPDYSEFTVVDGEEGDFGKITYRDKSGQVVAVKTVHGGDDEEVEFTPYGRAIMTGVLLPVLEKVLFPGHDLNPKPEEKNPFGDIFSDFFKPGR